MDLSVQQSCPSCGAAIVADEADRLLQCPFCGLRHYRVNSGFTRFVLPDKAPAHILREEIVYAPYLHFKGSIFSCRGRQVEHRVVDTTLAGAADSASLGLPPSLGLRPRAMTVSLLAAGSPGYFLPQSLPAEAAYELAAQSIIADPESLLAPLYHEACIGETISCLYLPLYIREGILHDAVTGRGLARVSESGLRQGCLGFQEKWLPRFLATLCPSCGGPLAGERDALVLECHNCHSLWEETGGALRGLDWQRIASRRRRARYLPFWKITVSVAGLAMKSFGDFLRLTNQPVVARPEDDRLPSSFWVPAFKMRPRIFLNLARTLTLYQKRFAEGKPGMTEGLFPVTLPRSEAVQALKTVLAEAAVNKRDFLPLLPDIELQPRAAVLVYLPFEDKGHDLVQEQTGVAVAAPVLRSGRGL